MTSEERFWRKVKKTDGCWFWMGGRNDDGYGIAIMNGHVCGAHRKAWAITRGPIPEGMQVLHHCDTPSCVRPDHLWLGTQKDNMQDMRRKGRSNMPMHRERWHCPRQPRPIRPPWPPTPRESPPWANNLREWLSRTGHTQKWLARQINVSTACLSNVLNGRTPVMRFFADRMTRCPLSGIPGQIIQAIEEAQHEHGD